MSLQHGEPLPFTVQIAHRPGDLAAAREVRAAAYGRHVPELGSTLTAPDPLDTQPDTTVVLARSKRTRAPIGTVRIAVNTRRPLQIEQAAPLPETLRTAVAAEITRLAVQPGNRDPALRLALMKAAYLTCLVRQARWMVIGARGPGLTRQYTTLGFIDIADGGLSVPLPHAGDLPHRILIFDVTAAERRWHATGHPLYDFMVRAHHPDIDLLRPPAGP